MFKIFFEVMCDYKNQVIQKMYSVIDLKISAGTSSVTFLGKRFLSKQPALFWTDFTTYILVFQPSEAFLKEFAKHFK